MRALTLRPSKQDCGADDFLLWPLRQDASTTLCTFYEITPASKEAAGQDPHTTQQFFVQFVTRYLHADGSHRIRVTTFTRRCCSGPTCSTNREQDSSMIPS